MKNEKNAIHGHTCRCGNHWEHTAENAGNTAAHTCGKCGREVWEKDFTDDFVKGDIGLFLAEIFFPRVVRE